MGWGLGQPELVRATGPVWALELVPSNPSHSVIQRNTKRSGASMYFILSLKYLLLVALFPALSEVWKSSTFWSSCEVPLRFGRLLFPWDC